MKGQIASSPFSEFGIGDLLSGGVAQNQAMGGIGISNPSGSYINNLNPALLVFNHFTLFQGGTQWENKKLSVGNSSQSFKNGNLNYLVLALPVKANRWTTSVGLTPYSNVNYNFSNQDYLEGSYQQITYNLSGKGGLSQFYWSNGVTINKYLSVGAKASYLFGTIVSQNSSYLPGAYANTSLYTRDAIHGVGLTGGISFHKDSIFRKNYRLNIGAVYSLNSNLNFQHIDRYQTTVSTGAMIDSLTYNKLGGTIRIPENMGVGISFGKIDRWTVGYDFVYLDYRSFDYRTTDHNTQYIGTPTVGYRSGLGVEFVPNPEDFTNYFSRVSYRLGASYEKSPMLVNKNPLIDAGVTFGFSLPVNRFSTVDLAFKVGRRGTVSENAAQENYFRMIFGITFFDQWFIKRKFD
ncbi:MAG: hypothetical protein JST48_00910 [Bacteroidetes bacterium]|nr:hypothetical protein [Bacteroidota bacterium]